MKFKGIETGMAHSCLTQQITAMAKLHPKQKLNACLKRKGHKPLTWPTIGPKPLSAVRLDRL